MNHLDQTKKNEKILKARLLLVDILQQYLALDEAQHQYEDIKPLKLNISKEFQNEIVFRERRDDKKVVSIPKELFKYLDFEDISFDKVDIIGMDFTGCKNVFINPQTVYGKNLKNAILTDVTFIGEFGDVDITGANFTGSKNAFINPQTIRNKDLMNVKLTDATITGTFQDTKTEGVDFTGVHIDVLENNSFHFIDEEMKHIK